MKERIFTALNYSQIKDCYKKTQDLLELYHSEQLRDLASSLKNLSSDGSFFTSVEKIRKEAILGFDQLNQIALAIELYLTHHSSLIDLAFTKEKKQDFHENKRYYQNNFLKEFRSFVSMTGEIDYFKHPVLRILYSEKLELEQSARKTLSQLIGDSNWSNKLQFNSFDLINDRYVLPIRSDSYKSELGQIVSRSDSGQTLFVEPSKLRQLNTKRLQTILALDKELNSLTLKFSNNLFKQINHLRLISNCISYFDEYLLRASFAHINNYVMPTLSNSKEIIIKKMFHPLIENPIKNDIKLDETKKGFIISGPNTGGKTATLKTIAIIQIFLRYGIYLPAQEVTIHPYENIFYFGNDGQNLPEGLSSFASEVKNYSDLVDNLAETNLIIIDEIFNSTSSEEASALAIALFDEIGKISSSHFLVSTHHQMLKSLIHEKDNFTSAHVGFDPKTNKPSYKIHTGTPGSSQALSIYTKLTEDNDFNKRVKEKAMRVLDNKMLNYESLLEKIAVKENELENTLRENKEINIQLKNQKNSMEGVYKLKLEEKVSQLDSKVKRILDKAQSHFQNVKRGRIDSARQVEKKSSEINSLVREITPKSSKNQQVKKDYSHMKSPKEIEVGASYFSTFLGHTVIVKSVNLKKKEAIVAKGRMSIKCPSSSLKIAHKEKGQSVQVNYTQNSKAQIEYDCRGMRLSEFETLVENAISDLLTDSVPFINFIHGHGNGTLKNWLRSYIKKNKSLSVDSNDNGNDGETRIILI